uniref:Uncharacterized protein n=1 Tax=Ascaris lumbricoides TaxID=6252 RepID=A0A0M3IBH9_ASCLU
MATSLRVMPPMTSAPFLFNHPTRIPPLLPVPTHIPPPPMPAGMLAWLITRGPLTRASPTVSSGSGRSSVSSAAGNTNLDWVSTYLLPLLKTFVGTVLCLVECCRIE